MSRPPHARPWRRLDSVASGGLWLVGTCKRTEEGERVERFCLFEALLFHHRRRAFMCKIRTLAPPWQRAGIIDCPHQLQRCLVRM